jgi:mannose-1-phosphate guanylyltransferase
VNVIMFCAGLHPELRPFTDYNPKCLLPINKKSILYHNLNLLERYNFKSVIVVQSFCAPQMVLALQKYTGTVNVKQITERTILGTARSIVNYMLGVDEDVIIMNGDNIYNFDLRELYDFHLKSRNSCTLGIHDVTKGESRKSVIKLTGHGMIDKYITRPNFKFKIPTTVNAEICVMNPKFREKIDVRKDYDFWTQTLKRNSDDICPFRINGVTSIDSADEYARIHNTYNSIDHFFAGRERY